MAKAKPAGRSAAKKSSKAKGKKRKNKGGVVEGRPIIVKGGALPQEDGDLVLAHTVVIDAHFPANLHWVEGAEYPFEYTYSDLVIPEIVTLYIQVAEDEPIELKVEGKNWSISMEQ